MLKLSPEARAILDAYAREIAKELIVIERAFQDGSRYSMGLSEEQKQQIVDRIRRTLFDEH